MTQKTLDEMTVEEIDDMIAFYDINKIDHIVECVESLGGDLSSLMLDIRALQKDILLLRKQVADLE